MAHMHKWVKFAGKMHTCAICGLIATESEVVKFEKTPDQTPRCLCGGMLAEVRGKPHCTICGGG